MTNEDALFIENLNVSAMTKTCLRKRCFTPEDTIMEARMLSMSFEDRPETAEKATKWKREVIQAIDEAGYIRHDILITRRVLKLMCDIAQKDYPLFLPRKEYEQLKALTEEELESVERALMTLSDRESEVLVLRYGLKGDNLQSHEEIARILRMSRNRVQEIETKALRKLSNPKRFCFFPEINVF